MNEIPTSQPLQEANQRVRTFVNTHGRVRVAVLCGGAASAVGTILPFAYVNGVFGGGTSYNIVQSGFYGFLLLAIAVALASFPIALKQFARFTLGAFGISCAIFGVFFAIWLASSGLASVLGGSIGGLSIGFYLSLLGYATMVVGYYMLVNEERSNA